MRVKFKYLRAEAGSELLEVDHAVVVPVELHEQFNAVLIKRRIVHCLSLDLSKDVLDVLLREHLGVVLHVFLGVFVGRDELEAEATKEDGPTDAEVLLLVVGLAHRVLVVLALHELATDAARVLVTHFVHLNGVITTVE